MLDIIAHLALIYIGWALGFRMGIGAALENREFSEGFIEGFAAPLQWIKKKIGGK